MSVSAPTSPHQPILHVPVPQRVFLLRETSPPSPDDFMEQYIRIEASINELFRAKSPEKAKAQLKSLSFEKYPTYIRARLYNMLSIAHLHLREWEAAWKTAKLGLGLNPEDSDEKAPLLFHCAVGLHYLGYKELAERQFRDILSMQNVHPNLIDQFEAEIQRVCPSAIE